MSDDLVAFLQAGLDKDERAAREAQPGPWYVGNAVDPTQKCNVHTYPGARGVADDLWWLDAEHIARHDPARVLREIEVKRRMLADYEATLAHAREREAEGLPANGVYARADAKRQLISIMATAYDDADRGDREDAG